MNTLVVMDIFWAVQDMQKLPGLDQGTKQV